MNDPIALRAATTADTKILAQLYVTTFPDKFGPILGQNAEPVLYDWLRLSQRQLNTTIVAEINQTVVGFIVLETSKSVRLNDGRWLWQALQLHHGLLGALRCLLLMILIHNNRPLDPAEIYIETLGVSPAWRGRGVAQRLLAHAEALAQSKKIDRLTLTVVSDNRSAIGLYEKNGFQVQTDRGSRLLKWITGHPGYYEMVKQL